MSDVRTETWRGPLIAVYPDGRRVAMERDAIITTDIRDTPFGPMDCGHTRLLPWREVELAPARPAPEKPARSLWSILWGWK